MTLSRRRLLEALGYTGVWLVLWLTIALAIFLNSERTIEVASHQASLGPTLSGEVVLRTGPVLPDLRIPSSSPFGLEIELGKTDADSLDELTARYAAIASQPEGQIAVVERAVRSMAVAALVQGAALGVVPLLVWAAVGAQRRRLLVRQVPTRRGLVAAGAAVVLVGAVAVPVGWGRPEDPRERWESLQSFVGREIELPREVAEVQVLADATTDQSHRLIESAVSGYRQGLEFYSAAARDAEDLDLRRPGEDERVTVLVSDRHDNIGMDKVARAIGDRAGATTVFDAGDDTSTGSHWEAFSLDSVAAAFDDYEGRWAVAGNHDNGTFVRQHLQRLGWTYFDDEVVDGPDGSRILGVDDPRSSGLGNWRDEKGLSFAEVTDRVTDAACAADADGKRPNTILVHDAKLGAGALAKGCVDLVVGGHIHVQSGPTAVTGENGKVGYTYTVGTTGGAAYAIAIGSKLRRAASIALLTYRDGRPVGVQSVTLQTNGRYDVDPWVPLTY